MYIFAKARRAPQVTCSARIAVEILGSDVLRIRPSLRLEGLAKLFSSGGLCGIACARLVSGRHIQILLALLTEEDYIYYQLLGVKGSVNTRLFSAYPESPTVGTQPCPADLPRALI